MSTGDLTPDTWSPAPVDPYSEGWVGTKHDPRFPMIHSAQSVIDSASASKPLPEAPEEIQ